MLVATRAFITTYDGKEVRLIPHQSYVIEGHEIALRHPDNFAPAPDRPHGSREVIRPSGQAGERRIAVPRADLGRESWRLLTSAQECQFFDRWSTTGVRFAASADEEHLAIV